MKTSARKDIHRILLLIVLFPITFIVGPGCGSGGKRVNPAGTLEATEVNLAPALSGKVLEVRAELGDRVNAGDTLVVIDTEPARLQRAWAEAGYAGISAQHRAATDALAQAERNLELLETSFSRTRALLAQGSASQQQFDEVEARRDVAARQVSAARNQIDILAAEKARLDATIALFDRTIADGLLTAAIDGTILLRAVEPGEMAMPGAVAIRLADLTRLDLRIYLDEEDLDLVHLGRRVTVLVDALEGSELEGTVTWISPEAEFTPKNAQTRNARAQLVYAVKVSVKNPDGVLHIGMPAEVEL